MTITNTLRLLACLGIAMTGVAEATAQAFLQYVLTPKESYTYASSATVSQTMSAMGQEIVAQTSVDTRLHITVRDAVMRQYTIVCTYDTARLRGRFQGLEGAMPDDTVMTYAGLAGRTETLTLTPLGNVVASNQTGIDEAQMVLSSATGGLFSGARAIFPIYAGRELKDGMSWTVDLVDTMRGRQVGGMVRTSARMLYTYVGMVDTLGRTCARVTLLANDLSLSGTMQNMGMDMVLEGDGHVSGEMLVELSTGMQMQQRTTSVLNARMAMTGQAQAIVPITTETVTTLRRLP